MAVYADFINKVQYDVLGCPRPVIQQAVKDAIITFCEKTLIFTETVDVNVVAGTREYPLVLSGGYAPVRIVEVMEGVKEIYPVFEGELDEAWREVEGPPTKYFMSYDKKLVLGELPKTSTTLSVKVAIKPSKAGTFDLILPDIILEDWETGIVAGATMLLQKMRDKGWSTQKQASVNNNIFRTEITKAKSKVLKSFTHKGVRAPYQKFGG